MLRISDYREALVFGVMEERTRTARVIKKVIRITSFKARGIECLSS